MSDIEKLTQRIIEFRDSRDWKQFHNPKDLAISLSLEAAEVLEHFQWKNGQELEEYLKTNKGEVADELMDVLYWVLNMCSDLEIDIPEAFEKKMQKNEAKYPVGTAKGKKEKYSEL
ncbi:MAG TPA: nucleotide pyrophosphohydrolase [Candidatus Paceibacterota bacterium]|nr:nucleotide pyrophosphohydrolase [Candidatus Paceibacterota bacterium]